MKKPAVLIVDDDPSHLRIYGWIIQSAGFESVSAIGRGLLQSHHQEFTGNNSNAVGIRRSFFGTVNWMC
jgi:hypothetical protein